MYKETEYHLTTLLDSWPLAELLSSLQTLEAWCCSHLPDCTNITLQDIWRPVPNAHNRIDIQIRYCHGGKYVEQKLLMLKGQILDGAEFHKRYKEFYG